MITIKGDVCFLEPHSESFEHELVNSEIVRRVLSAITDGNAKVYFLCTAKHAESLKRILSLEEIARIQWIYIANPLNSYSLTSVVTIFRLLRQFQSSNISFVFLSCGSSDLYASLLKQIIDSRHNTFFDYFFVLHGVLTNFDVRSLRPDPFIYRHGRLLRFSFSRFIFFFPFALKTVIRLAPSSRFYVLGSWIRENLIEKLPTIQNRISIISFPTPILQRRMTDFFVKPNRLLLIGYNNIGMLEQLCQKVFETNSKLELDIVTNTPDRYSKIAQFSFVKLHLDNSRESIARIASTCNFLLILRSRQLWRYQTSGVLLESISLGVPLIFPNWMRVMLEDCQEYSGITYAGKHELFELLLFDDKQLDLNYNSEVAKLENLQNRISTRYPKNPNLI